jgi:hypothetical protein
MTKLARLLTVAIALTVVASATALAENGPPAFGEEETKQSRSGISTKNGKDATPSAKSTAEAMYQDMGDTEMKIAADRNEDFALREMAVRGLAALLPEKQKKAILAKKSVQGAKLEQPLLKILADSPQQKGSSARRRLTPTAFAMPVRAGGSDAAAGDGLTSTRSSDLGLYSDFQQQLNLAGAAFAIARECFEKNDYYGAAAPTKEHAARTTFVSVALDGATHVFAESYLRIAAQNINAADRETGQESKTAQFQSAIQRLGEAQSLTKYKLQNLINAVRSRWEKNSGLTMEQVQRNFDEQKAILLDVRNKLEERFTAIVFMWTDEEWIAKKASGQQRRESKH